MGIVWVPAHVGIQGNEAKTIQNEKVEPSFALSVMEMFSII